MHHFIITVLNFYLCESATSLLLAIIQQEQSDNSSRCKHMLYFNTVLSVSASDADTETGSYHTLFDCLF